jgi:hypothetical protein
MDLDMSIIFKMVALCSKHLPYDLICIGVWMQRGSKEDDTKRIGEKGDIAAGGKIKLLVFMALS